MISNGSVSSVYKKLHCMWETEDVLTSENIEGRIRKKSILIIT